MDQPFSFQDIFSKKFLDAFSMASFNVPDLLITMAVCLVIGIGIYLVYRFSFNGVVYDNSYAVSLILACIITCLIIKAISFNIVLSLGMVGALSIIRFRTAIKDPIDIVFMFWAVAVGIICGAGIFFLAFIGSAVIAVTLFILNRKLSDPRNYLLIIHANIGFDEKALEKILREGLIRFNMKSKILDPERIEISYQVRLRKEGQDALQGIKNIEKVESVSLINYNPNTVP